MKVLVVLALAFANVSAGVMPQVAKIHPRDMTAVPSIEGRITNGQTAAENQFPYQVALIFSSPTGNWLCGGSIIDKQWVLTAAHCTRGAAGVKIYYGAVDRFAAKHVLPISSANFVQHAEYNQSTKANDISLIKTPIVTFSESINKVVLPSITANNEYPDFTGLKAIASGWGRISDATTEVTNILQFEMFEVVSVATCRAVFGEIVTPNIICIATPNQKSTCNGDSGGPLVLDNNKQLIGVTAFGSSRGCENGTPAAFTRVTSYLAWIKEISNVSY